MDLHLHVKHEYFEQIKSKKKKDEYRLLNDHWKKVLYDREYDRILIYDGYPKKGDTSRILIRKYDGMRYQRIRHPHFGPGTVEVFAIKVND